MLRPETALAAQIADNVSPVGVAWASTLARGQPRPIDTGKSTCPCHPDAETAESAARTWEGMTHSLESKAYSKERMTYSKERMVHSSEPVARSLERMSHSKEWVTHSLERAAHSVEWMAHSLE